MNQKILSLAICLFLSSAVVCQKDKGDEYSGYVKYEATTTTGTVTVLSTGFGKKKPESSKDAVREAFYALLFRGIPGSQYELPMIKDESEKKDHPVVKEILEDGGSFVSEDILVSENKKVKRKDGVKGIMTLHRITINCESLRRYLEQKNIIRKFGI